MNNRLLVVILMAAVIPLVFSLYFLLVEKPLEKKEKEETGEVRVGTLVEAPVEEVAVEVGDKQILVVARGKFPDGCYTMGEHEITRDGSRISIKLMSWLDVEMVCIQALVPFEEWIPIDRVGMENGEYVVEVNGVEESFTL